MNAIPAAFRTFFDRIDQAVRLDQIDSHLQSHAGHFGGDMVPRFVLRGLAGKLIPLQLFRPINATLNSNLDRARVVNV